MPKNVEVSERGRLPDSRNREDHPHASEQRCAIGRSHGPHPYGPIHVRGGLIYWCGGAYVSRAFKAQYPARCSRDDCPDPQIREGELVHYGANDRIEHGACPEPPPMPDVCPRCFLALPASGVCGVCD